MHFYILEWLQTKNDTTPIEIVQVKNFRDKALVDKKSPLKKNLEDISLPFNLICMFLNVLYLYTFYIFSIKFIFGGFLSLSKLERNLI